MTDRQTKRISAYSDDGLIRMPALGFIDLLNEEIGKIPEEFRASAEIEIDSETDYDGHNATFSIEYKRPETDEEMFVRHSHEAESKIRQERKDRETFLALKAKYGDA